jgi:hypothetical protein
MSDSAISSCIFMGAMSHASGVENGFLTPADVLCCV